MDGVGDRGGMMCFDLGSLGEVVMHVQMGVGLVVLDRDRRVVFHNPEWGRLIFGDAKADYTGKTLYELFPREWMAVRDDVIERVLGGNDPILIRSIARGRHMEAVVHGVCLDGEGPEDHPGWEDDGRVAHVLVVVRPGSAAPDGAKEDQVEVVEAEAVDLGKLSVLTPRELEVLALIGHAKSGKEIGALLGISPRTVERHRDSIGKKLQAQDRVTLASIAWAAGLEVADAKRARIEVSPKDPGGS